MTRWEELGMTAEEYVRSRWKVVIDEGATLLGNQDGRKPNAYFVAWDPGGWESPCCFVEDTARKAWLAAAEFTAKHEVVRRVLTTLESQLADLLKGWKERP